MKNLFNYTHKWVFFSTLFFALFFAAQNAKAEDLYDAGSFGSISSGGYVDITIPVYDCDGSDEAVYVGRAYIQIDGTDYELFFWDSQINEDEWQPDSGHHSHWARIRKNDTNTAAVFVGGNQVTASYQYFYTDNHSSGTVTLTVRVYFAEFLLQNHMGKTVKLHTYVRIDENSDGKGAVIVGDKSASATMPSWSKPVINPPALSSSTPGMYDVSWSIPGTPPAGSQYNWEAGNNWTTATAGTQRFDIADTQQPKTLRYRYNISDYQWITVSENVIIPAYQQPRNLAVANYSDTDNTNADTRITWTTAASQTNQETGDNFEVQRSTDSGFTSPVTVGTLSYDPNKTTPYEIIDRTSELNHNGTVYYRVRRTKAISWNWAVCATANIVKSMSHKGIAAGSVTETIDSDNNVTLTWAYNNGNVWSSGSKIVIKRIRLDNNLTETKELDYNAATTSYNERLTEMCKEFHYTVHIKPGNTKYPEQTAIDARLADPDVRIVPMNLGAITSLTASKGYFFDRTVLEWVLDGAMETFSIQRRTYGLNEEFRQIETRESSAAATQYTYTDQTGVPGVVYEYRIAGMTSCATGTETTFSPVSIGFRTPTGDFYGRVTYENGQAVEGVTVSATTEDVIPMNSLSLTSGGTAIINNAALLRNNTDSVSLQAWIKPQAGTGIQKIISKNGMYELGINNAGSFYFKAGTDELTSGTTVAQATTASGFVHISGAFSGDSLFIYINGKFDAKKATSVSFTGNANPVTLGGGYAGIIDEVRIWGRALSANEIERDYNRYLTGSETALLGYYTFNYVTDKEFFDISYRGTNYNANHGLLNTATVSQQIPTAEQLGYKGITASDGSYSIRSVPYTGNGTAYYLVPKLGIHQFESQREIRFISAQAQSHTVNFIDKSSFDVSGYISYRNSNIPVEGVRFDVDGITVMRNGLPVLSGSDGRFDIKVPVGVHEVKAVKDGHIFENGGRITDQRGVDLNYQDNMFGFELKDSTTIKYIGRVAGGTIQEAFPLGHSLSQNNLSEGITVTLTYPNPAYRFGAGSRNEENIEITETHFKPSHAEKALTNKVQYIENRVVIHVNDSTGEFVAHVIPEQFSVNINAGMYHSDVPGNGSTINLTQQFNKQQIPYTYTVEVEKNGAKTKQTFSDTVFYNFSQKFIKRYAPEIRVVQTMGEKELPYFGSDSVKMSNLLGVTTTAPVYNKHNNTYTFGKPVFETNKQYGLKMSVFERYNRYALNGAILSADEVPTQDAVFKFNNDLSSSEAKLKEVPADSIGVATYSFHATEPELTSGIRSMNLSVTYGRGDSQTSIAWVHPAGFNNGEAYIVGAHQTGTDFVTSGPDKVLMVLRDPPGSNSYSYLEKGVSFKESSAYTGSLKNAGNETFVIGASTSVMTWHGVGSGVINTVIEAESGVKLGILHEEKYEGQDTKTTTTTTTTRFQTSDDPELVGANGDLYIGNSTNITFGSTQNVVIVPKDSLHHYPDAHYNTTSSDKWALVYKVGRSLSQTFKTLFAYPQVHVEQRLIPQLTEIRNRILLETLQSGATQAQLQASANANDTCYYFSLVRADDNNFGKENYYEFITPTTPNKTFNDTIAYLNQSIQNWISRMSDNEKAKVDAKLLQNYSFHSGSNIEYSERYSTTVAHSSSFYVMLGGKIANDWDIKTTGTKLSFQLEESIETQHGGTWTSEVEASHSKGFVLADSGNDYLSVDVCREKGWSESDEEYDTDRDGGMVDKGDIIEKDYYPSFIFKTKGGATSCPYEDKYVTKYFEPGQHILNEATMRIEVPEIDIKEKFVENVPSGETAKLTLYLRNNSEINQDLYYNLFAAEDSNPNGATFHIDGAAIGNGRTFIVPAGQTLVKTLEVGKGRVLNYDNLQLILASQCQYFTYFSPDVADTVSFTVHFIPSCTNVNLGLPANNWVYNTKLNTVEIDGVDQHYMPVLINGFNVNYDNFGWIKLQYKSASQSDEAWTTVMNYYNDSTLYKKAIENGLNAEMIKASDAGAIRYNFMMDALPDQRYDIRAVSVCVINNEEIENPSEIRSGIKDMYPPRLFGSVQPATGILGVGDEIRLNFNEPIAQGLLTRNNFQVRGVRNGTISDHSTSVRFDGVNDYMDTEFSKNLKDKSLTVEMWIQPGALQNATIFSHGNINESMEMSITSDNKLKVKVGAITVTSPVLNYSPANPNYADGSWAHVALVYDAAAGKMSAYYNYNEVIQSTSVEASYSGIGNIVLGKSITTGSGNYSGKMHNVRVWEKVVNSRNIQLNSLLQLSGIEEGLMAYYPMNEGRGILCQDKARGATMTMRGAEWALPGGFAVATNGTGSYLKIDASTAAFTKEMDFTVEFWFKAEPGQTDATILSAGSGEAGSSKPENGFAVGFNAQGRLTIANNNIKTVVDGEYRDNNWHHFAFSVDRAKGRAQIYMNGKLTNYIDAAGVGGIASDFFYLGARGWYNKDNPTLIVDNYFKGLVDDLRFWELYKNEKMVSDNNNVKLSGEEFGLVHYYPFDTYIEFMGVKFIEFTNLDMRISHTPNPETDSFTVVGATAETIRTKDIAPLKDFGPVADLDFDFVVNNDALIINLKEQEYKIARTIVTFTVFDVRDLNGNSIVSPITWSAYIDRNQLRWETDQITVSKPVFEPYQFAVKAVNNGGSVMKYTINNIPSWLDVTPTSGTLNPKAYNNISFSINEGLNVGTYNEVIYLTNEDNVSEPLALNVKVEGKKPDWKVNPADFNYNMSVFGKMRFNKIFSSNSEDILAAFDKNGKCIGVTNSIYNKTFDMWYALLTIYNNNRTDDGIEFRMWEAGTGKIYKATPDRTITFVNNSVVGDVAIPVIFDGSEITYNDIPLSIGWNWISFNLKNDDLLDVNKTMAGGSWTLNDVIKNEDFFVSYSENNKKWTGDLSGFDNTSMYILRSSYNQYLSVWGSAIDPKSTDGRITVRNGWNYIGYIPSANMTVKEALAGYNAQKGDIIKSPTSFSMYSNNEWIGTLGYMEPGKGYMLLRTANNATTFNYPSVSAVLNKTPQLKQEEQSCGAEFANNMVVIATTTEGIQSGDRINAYVNGVLRGTGKYVASGDSQWNFITISGDEKTGNIHFELERNGKILGNASNRVNYNINGVAGNIEQPLLLDFSAPENEVTVYPNPFRDLFYVMITSTENEQVQLTLTDIIGRQLRKEIKPVKNGVNRIEMNGASLPAGTYLLQVTIKGVSSAHKIEKR